MRGAYLTGPPRRVRSTCAAARRSKGLVGTRSAPSSSGDVRGAPRQAGQSPAHRLGRRLGRRGLRGSPRRRGSAAAPSTASSSTGKTITCFSRSSTRSRRRRCRRRAYRRPFGPCSRASGTRRVVLADARAVDLDGRRVVRDRGVLPYDYVGRFPPWMDELRPPTNHERQLRPWVAETHLDYCSPVDALERSPREATRRSPPTSHGAYGGTRYPRPGRAPIWVVLRVAAVESI
jgi:hypothetical protein